MASESGAAAASDPLATVAVAIAVAIGAAADALPLHRAGWSSGTIRQLPGSGPAFSTRNRPA